MLLCVLAFTRNFERKQFRGALRLKSFKLKRNSFTNDPVSNDRGRWSCLCPNFIQTLRPG